MGTKRKVGILFGGRSVEHQVSINSAKNIFQYIDKSLFEVILIGIDKNGNWHLLNDVTKDISSGDELSISMNAEEPFFNSNQTSEKIKIDIMFPVLHGTDGEDGSIQGLLKVFNIPCVGTGVLGSAISMNKLISKKLFEKAGIPNANFVNFNVGEKEQIIFDQVVQKINLPLIAKPVSLGSSVGVSKVNNRQDFERTIDEIFLYDNNILFEEFISGREMECAVLGNYPPEASFPGEIKINTNYDLYSFNAKYVDPNAAELIIPASLENSVEEKIKTLAVQSFIALCCEDYARVDLFLSDQGEVFINEINTIPGFTNISMFPMLWGHSGINYPNLITKLIDLALERFEKQNQITTEFESKLD